MSNNYSYEVNTTMDETKIREEIRKNLKEELFYEKKLIFEGQYGITVTNSEFYDIFIKPWKNAIKNAFIELKKITSQVVTTIRLMFTLNQKKAEEIKARQKDRMKKFEAESKEVFEALGGDASARDFMFLTFMVNPGAFVATKLVSSAPGAKAGVIQFAKEIGLGDKSIDTATGDEKEEDALIRRREQDGPITKALRALEQIFLLAHAESPGNILMEAEGIDGSALTDEIMKGPLGAQLKEQQRGFIEDMKAFVELVKSTAAQNAFMASVGSIDTAENPSGGLAQMEQALAQLEQVDPEAAKPFKSLPGDIRKEAEILAKDEKFHEQVKESAGEEEVDFEKSALRAVMGSAFQDSINEYREAINANKELIQGTVNDLFPAEVLNDDFIISVNAQAGGFKDAIRLVERILEKKITS